MLSNCHLQYAYGAKLVTNECLDDISVGDSLQWFGFNASTPVQMALEVVSTEAAVPADLLSNRYSVVDGIEELGGEDYLITDTRGANVLVEKMLEEIEGLWSTKMSLTC